MSVCGRVSTILVVASLCNGVVRQAPAKIDVSPARHSDTVVAYDLMTDGPPPYSGLGHLTMCGTAKSRVTPCHGG